MKQTLTLNDVTVTWVQGERETRWTGVQLAQLLDLSRELLGPDLRIPDDAALRLAGLGELIGWLGDRHEDRVSLSDKATYFLEHTLKDLAALVAVQDVDRDGAAEELARSFRLEVAASVTRAA